MALFNLSSQNVLKIFLTKSSFAQPILIESGSLTTALPYLVVSTNNHASAAMTLDVYADLFDTDLDALADRLDSAIGPRANFAAEGRRGGEG